MNIRKSGSNNTKLQMSLVRDTLYPSFGSVVNELPHHTDKSHLSLWLQSGCIKLNDKALAKGQGMEITAIDKIKAQGQINAVVLRFIVSTASVNTANTRTYDDTLSEVLFTQSINTSSTRLLLRLDQVDFPPAAVAYKHTHPGPGIRYLADGGLTLKSDHGEHKITRGNAWFEDADSAVMATAINSSPSRFVRLMLLPLEYEGRSTFTLHSQTDADKPKLQTNIRHFEKIISVNSDIA